GGTICEHAPGGRRAVRFGIGQATGDRRRAQSEMARFSKSRVYKPEPVPVDDGKPARARGRRAFFSDFPCVASLLRVFGIAAGSPPSRSEADLLRPHRSPYCLRARSLGKLAEKCSSGFGLECGLPRRHWLQRNMATLRVLRQLIFHHIR